MTEETRRRFKRWLWRPPRPHGEVRPDRNVSFLELFYDLVYVAVIAQAAHHLAEHVTVRGVVEFAVVFSLIWVAWVNGSLYVELHGRDDGRTRNLVFIQMAILALLAVFTAEAPGATGPAFAVVYAALPGRHDVAMERGPSSGPTRIHGDHRAVRGGHGGVDRGDPRERAASARAAAGRLGSIQRHVGRR